MAFSWLGRCLRDVRRGVDLFCVALARSANFMPFEPVSSATASVVVSVSILEGVSSSARLLTLSRRSTAPSRSFTSKLSFCFVTGLFSHSFPNFSANLDWGSFVSFIVYFALIMLQPQLKQVYSQRFCEPSV
jgi:hypothetical protein